MSNFTITNKEYKNFSKMGIAAENEIYTSPRSSLLSFGAFAELLTHEIFRLDGLEDWNLKQIDRLDKLTRSSNDYPDTVLLALNRLRKLRNPANHNGESFYPNTKMALEADKDAYIVWKWFLEIFTQENVPKYTKPQDNTTFIQEQELKIKELQEKITQLQASQPVVQVSEQVRETRRKINQLYAKNHPLTEAETRELIDEQLRIAGWEVDTNKLNNWKNKTMPKNGHNMAISEWVLPNKERADYALFIGKKLVGIVEAKKYGTDIAGKMDQPKEYALNVDDSNGEIELVNGLPKDYHVPFIYATNGRKYLKQYEEKSGIWFWDSRNPEDRSKALEKFHSPEDLNLKLVTPPKKQANEELKIDEDYPIAGRDYQINAIKAIENGLKNGRTRMLLVMATGTGKTRTALSLMYRLLKHKRAKRILYLVDRNSLGKQTADAAKDNKVNGLPLASIYGIKELEERLPDASTKIQIATVQGMIKRLFYHNKNSEKMETLSVGTYDFIIVDEAHRGYNQDSDMSEEDEELYDQNEYISQYRHVVDYFDATAIGLTATPALQTIQIFGKPIYSYNYTQAVLDGYLVDHDAPHIIDTELSKEGIHLKKGEKVTYFDPNENVVDYTELPDDMNFDLKDFNTRVITPNFNEVVADHLASKLDPTNPELGKTLIFAANDQHADMIVTKLKNAFEKAGNPVSDDAIKKITGSIHNPNEVIRRFKNEDFPNIAVTVDLLSTGIDIPKITTLVFMRQIKSRILYEQMLGRATRLCPEIHKDHFTIYDAVGIYNAMQEVSDMKSITKDLHHDVKYFLKHKDYFEVKSEDQNSHQYQIEMAAAVERKIKRLDETKRKEFEGFAQVDSVDNWARKLTKISVPDFVKEWDKFKILNKLPSHRPVQLISNAEDKVVDERRDYGNGISNPEEYLECFNNYIKNNLNKIVTLDIITTRPKDLTLEELKDISSKLKNQNFEESKLQDAWKETTHTQTTANIISFIRQAALGSSLIEPEERINQVMKKINGIGDWNPKQEEWLGWIAKRLERLGVLGPNAEHALNDDKLWFRKKGGYKEAKKVFKNAPISLEEVIETLNNNLYV